ncbi:piggyBac transposable element-derived protein 3-like [Schistocerca serialis cubense]|uniref:piggyBac transposable element-derived protein 3-like n=1 Tax=Schistocerca serialis cubense TaxID=2023355 RepID=UPI00214E327D|nr:piggyBac transposable element-derived protein 3-like [Schistocerca serialis cubense]
MSGEVSDLELSENDESGPDDAESIPQCTRPGADVVTNYEEEQLEDEGSTEEDDQNHTYAQDSNVEDSIIPSEWVFTEKSGTARLCRMPNVPFTSDKDLKKKGCGFSEEVVSMNEAVIMCKWFDNKPVVLASNFVGCGSQDEVQHWEKSRKTYVSVSRPEVVRRYNHAMGGVDKKDMLISTYRIFIKSRKWTLKMLLHAVDLSCVNSWLEYKRNTESLGEKETMDLLHFKMRIGEALVKMGTSTKVKRDRPSSDL